jgi:hypothetical protein
MEGYLSLYRCRAECHVILLTWAEPVASEHFADATFVVTVIPKTQHGAIRNRVEGVDRFQAIRAEFKPMKTWVECYARLIDEDRAHPHRRCWEPSIRRAAAHIIDVELRSIPLWHPPYAVL